MKLTDLIPETHAQAVHVWGTVLVACTPEVWEGCDLEGRINLLKQRAAELVIDYKALQDQRERADRLAKRVQELEAKRG